MSMTKLRSIVNIRSRDDVAPTTVTGDISEMELMAQLTAETTKLHKVKLVIFHVVTISEKVTNRTVRSPKLKDI